jgi:hypothetical protein
VDPQQLLTLGVVLAAISYLARRTWLRLSGRSNRACGSCSGCRLTAGGVAPAAGPLVPIETVIASAGQSERKRKIGTAAAQRVE